MSVHIEWISGEYAMFDVRPAGDEIGDGDVVQNPVAVVFGDGDSALVIDGTHEQLTKLLVHALAAVIQSAESKPNGWVTPVIRVACPLCHTLLDEDGYCTDVGCSNCGKTPDPAG